MINVDIPVSSTQVHPRIRGEYYYESHYGSREEGSPPHPRGIWLLDKQIPVKPRFTPASAGNIKIILLCWYIIGVHPRIRGEYTKQILIFPNFSPYHASNFI